MAAKKGKLNFKIILIVLLTIGVAISIYALTTQNLENRSSAGWSPTPSVGWKQPTKAMDAPQTEEYKQCVKACGCDSIKKDCQADKKYCDDFCNDPDNAYGYCAQGTSNCKRDYSICMKECDLCKKECKKQYK